MFVNLINLDTFEGSYDYEMGWNRAQRVQVVCNWGIIYGYCYSILFRKKWITLQKLRWLLEIRLDRGIERYGKLLGESVAEKGKKGKIQLKEKKEIIKWS